MHAREAQAPPLFFDLEDHTLHQCVQLHQDFIADLEKYPSAEEAKPLLGFVCTAAKYAEDHRDVIAKWSSCRNTSAPAFGDHFGWHMSARATDGKGNRVE
eukprot:1062878-Pelagomonas_calceolata.AAC.2